MIEELKEPTTDAEAQELVNYMLTAATLLGRYEVLREQKLEEQEANYTIPEYKEWRDNYPKRLQDIYNLNISKEEKDKRIDELDILGESIRRRYVGVNDSEI